MKHRFIAFFAVLALLFTAILAVFPATAASEGDWIATNPNAPMDYAYSFAFVGDTQVLSMLDAGNIPEEYNGTTKKANVVYPAGDTKGNTRYMDILYDWLVANKSTKKIEYVFGLGDITENIICAPGTQTGNSETSIAEKQNNKEWQIAYNAISQLNGVIPYSLACGNHDVGKGFNKYFNNSTYLNQFTNNNGGYRSTAITTYRELVLGEHKYLIITLPYSPDNDSLEWAANILGQTKFANHKAIITTHAYLTNQGELINEKDQYHTTSGDNMWYNYFSKYANVYMIVAGHVGVTDPVISYKTGVHGNLVTQVLIDPQNDDIGTKSTKDNGDGTTTTTITANPTGMVAMFYFSENGKVVDIEYISTIRVSKGLSPYLKEKNQQTLDYRFDSLSELGKYGYENYSVILPSITAPSIDGVIHSNEYKAAYTNTPMGKTTVSERFAYDATNLYFGFSYKIPEGTPPTSLTFNFSAQDTKTPIKDNTTLTYNLTNNTYSLGGYGVTSGNMTKSNISAKAVTADGVISFEIAINIDAIQAAYKFERQTVSYTLETNTGDKRGLSVSKELSDIFAEDYYVNNLNTFPQHVVFAFNSKTAFNEFGHSPIYLGSKPKTPTLNGVVANDEYLYKNTVLKNDLTSLQNAISTDIEEYLSYDNDYIYAAMVLKNDTDTTNTFYFNIHSLRDGSYNSACRISFIITLASDGTITTKNAEWRAPGSIPKHMNPLDSSDWDATAKHDTQNNTTTIEYKFSKLAVTNMLKVDTLEYFGFSSVVKGNFRYWNYSKISQKSSVVALTSQWEGRTQSDNQFLPIYVYLSDPATNPVRTINAASIRLSGPSGLRFATEVDKGYVDYLVNKYGADNVSVGTLIVPTDKLSSVSFTAKALDNAGIQYLNISASINNPFEEKGDTNVYTGAIVNIKTKNLTREFSAIGYICYKENGVSTYIYSNTSTSRSVSTISQNALNDLSTIQNNKYIYAIEGTSKYSPYSTAERKVLYSLIFSNVTDPFKEDIFGS